jgi:hypothetical protein
MKKIKLNLSGAKELNRAQQRSINGGSGSTDCIITCGDGSTIKGGPDCNVNVRSICAEDGNNGITPETCECPEPIYV